MVILRRVLPPIADRVWNTEWETSRFTIYFTLFCVLTLLSLALVHTRCFAMSHWNRTSLKYWPPTILAVIPSVVLTLGLDGLGRRYVYADYLRAAGLFALALCAADALFQLWHPSKSDGSLHKAGHGKAIGLKELARNPHLLIEWLEEEAPIRHPAQDMLSLRHMAERIAERLCDSKSRLQTGGIIGPWGSGKSSVLRLVDHHLGEQNDAGVWTCTIGGWGLRNGETVAGFLLRKAVAEIGKHIDPLTLAQLPSNYQAAVANAGGFWSSCLHLISGTSDPTDVLDRLDHVLNKANARLVVFLEDLDRDSGHEHLGNICATLDRIRDLQNVSFILAVDKAERVDFSRLCEWTETMPTVPYTSSREIVNEVRNLCIAQSEQDIDPAANECRKVFLRPDQGYMYDYLDGERVLTEEAICRLLNTPRALKTALRRTWSTWKVVHGEVDLDDLIILNVLRTGAPEAWDYVLENLPDFYKIQRGADSNNEPEALKGKWKKVKMHADRQSVEYLVKELFPAWPVSTRQDRILCPQGIAADRRYWPIAADAVLDDPRHNDQNILREVEAWKTQSLSTADFIRLISEDEEFAKRVVHFSVSPSCRAEYRLEPADVRRLVWRAIKDATRRCDPSISYQQVPCLEPLEEIATQQDWRGPVWFPLILIKRTLTRSLHLAIEIEDKWASMRGCMLTGEQEKQVRAGFIAMAQCAFRNPKSLAEALDPQWPYVFADLLRKDNAKTRSSDWQWLIPIMLSAAEDDPRIVVPQLAMLVCSGLPTPHVDDIFINEFFGKDSDRRRLFSVLGQDIDLSALPPKEQATVHFILRNIKSRGV